MKPRRSSIIKPLTPGSIFSYELNDHQIRERLFGVIPFRKIKLSEIHFLRLATKEELPVTALIFDWGLLLPGRRSKKPTYIIQTKYDRLLIPLQSGSHFMLRQAIAKTGRTRHQRIAA